MGMVMNLLRVSEPELAGYLKDSDLLFSRIYPDESTEEDSKLIDIDKAWDGVIFLLTGQNYETVEHPLARIFWTGQIIDEKQDLGYGPACYITSDQVADLAIELDSILISDLRNRFDAQKMDDLGVYPDRGSWDSDELREWVISSFLTVKSVYSEAANNGEAVITFLN